MQYTVAAVSPTVKDVQTKFGDMKVYRLKFNETDASTVVELMQKDSTPAPSVGDTLNGTIDMSGQYGPKFKKDKDFGSSPRSSGGNYSRPPFVPRNDDPFTMYLSYAKDIAVALIGTKEGYDQEKLSSILDDVLAGGKVLYEGRPSAGSKPVEAADSDIEKAKKALGVKDVEVVDDYIEDDIPTAEIPF